MADTRQVVGWALERKCPYRNGKGWEQPSRTYAQLSDMTELRIAIADNRVIDGVCVTGWSLYFPESERGGALDFDSAIGVPCSGFVIAERFGQYGDVDAVEATCKACDANTGGEMAGCHGDLSFYPDSEELDEFLQGALLVTGLQDELESAFLLTSPLWYGFWIRSPLRRTQASLLLRLFAHAFKGDNQERTGMDRFLGALEVAEKLDWPLHVEFAPLGHTDLGWYTVFPHCPRCKANAPVGRWKDEFPRDTHSCEVCGFDFVPDDTHHRERMDFDRETDSLESQVGADKFPDFVRRFIMARGGSRELAEAAWQDELERRESEAGEAPE